MINRKHILITKEKYGGQIYSISFDYYLFKNSIFKIKLIFIANMDYKNYHHE